MARNLLKEELIEKTATDLQQPQSVVKDTLGWMFRDVLKAVKKNSQVELSGFGTLLLSKPKVRRRVEKLERIKGRLEIKASTENVEERLAKVNEDLAYFYSKLITNAVEEDMGGVEKSDDPTIPNERGDSQSGGGEAGDLQGMS